MAPFEALYGRRCRTPLNWSEAGERSVFGPDMVGEAEEQVRVIQENLKIAKSRQKSYADKKRQSVSFRVGEHVYLRVSPMKGVQRFGVKGKLAPRYVGPFPIIQRCGPVAYRLELPAQLSAVHNIFHVSQLRKCLHVPSKAIDIENLQVEPISRILNILSKFLTAKTELPDVKLEGFIKCNGVITPKMKPHGSKRMF